jgi:YesN/AraC family two-component response regulator
VTAILLDRRLPDGNGDELLTQLRQLAPDAAVVMVTGYADVEAALHALRCGATDYLLKPINPDLLRATLARVAKLREAETRAIQAERLAPVGQMVAIVTHESRNALQRSRAFLEELRDILPDRPDALELIDGIRRGHDELKRILEEIRAFAAPVTLDRSICGLSKIWRQAWDELGIARKNRDASLREETNVYLCWRL